MTSHGFFIFLFLIFFLSHFFIFFAHFFMSNVHLDFISGFEGIDFNGVHFYFKEMYTGLFGASAFANLITLLQLWKTDIYQFIYEKSGATTLDALRTVDSCRTLFLSRPTYTEDGERPRNTTPDGYYYPGHRAFYCGFYLIDQLSEREQFRLLCRAVPCFLGRLSTIQSECRRNGISLDSKLQSDASSPERATADGADTGVVHQKREKGKRQRDDAKVRSGGKSRARKDVASVEVVRCLQDELLPVGTNNNVQDCGGKSKDIAVDTKSPDKCGKRSPARKGSGNDRDDGKNGTNGTNVATSDGTTIEEEASGFAGKREQEIGSGIDGQSGGGVGGDGPVTLSQNEFQMWYQRLHCDWLTKVLQIEDDVEKERAFDNIITAWTMMCRVQFKRWWSYFGVDEQDGKKAIEQTREFIQKHIQI